MPSLVSGCPMIFRGSFPISSISSKGIFAKSSGDEDVV